MRLYKKQVSCHQSISHDDKSSKNKHMTILFHFDMINSTWLKYIFLVHNTPIIPTITRLRMVLDLERRLCSLKLLFWQDKIHAEPFKNRFIIGFIPSYLVYLILLTKRFYMLGVFSYFSKVFVSPIFRNSITNKINFMNMKRCWSITFDRLKVIQMI